MHYSDSLKLLVIIINFICTQSGPNNLNMYDGTSTADMIAGDVFFEIVDPAELEYTYRVRPAKDFGAPFNQSFQVRNVQLVPIQPQFGCYEPENVDDIVGNVVLVERGDCSFKRKSLIAERSGARAVIITDIINRGDEYMIEMINDNTDDEVNIPVGFLMGKNGLMITKTLEKLHRNYAIINLPVNLTFVPIHKMNQPPWLGW